MSLTFLERYYQFIDDNVLKSQSIEFMNKALPSLLQRVDGLGNIDLSDSTRITEIGHSGKQKTLDWPNIYQGLISTCQITGSEGYCRLRDLIVDPFLIVTYHFNIQENGIKSIGKDRYGVIYARTPNNVGDGTPLGSSVLAVGVTGGDGDYAYDLTGTVGMGVGNGKFAYTRDLDSIDGLLSITLTGWFKTDVAETLGEDVELFKTKKLKFTSVNNGHLKLFVDIELDSDSVVSSKADWNNVNSWTHFAVSYDGTSSVGNVKF